MLVPPVKNVTHVMKLAFHGTIHGTVQCTVLIVLTVFLNPTKILKIKCHFYSIFTMLKRQEVLSSLQN